MDGPLAQPRPRPGWLTALGVIAVVLGSFGIVGGIQVLSQSRAAPADVERQFTNMLERMPGMRTQPKELRDAVQEAVPGVIKVEQRWKRQRVALAAADVLLSALLLIGALTALRLQASGRWLWLNASLALIPVEIAGALMQVLVARDNAAVWIAALVKAGDVPGAEGELGVVRRVMIGVAVALYGTKALALCGYYVTTLVMLTRARARALFVAPPPPDERG
jgi:hypothetical protein